MPTPTIPDGELFMNATLYTGTGAAQSITNGVAGQSFQPDFVWIKARSTTTNNRLYDSVRGATLQIQSNTTDAEAVNANGLTAFGSNGFTVGSASSENASGQTFVGWQWKAGGTAVSNTQGTITSSVSANQTSGFSVVTYTGTGSNGTVGHGLSVLGIAPQMIFFKVRSNGTYGWYVYNSVIGATNHLVLNTTAASSSSSFLFNDTAPTSTVMSVGTSPGTNQSGQTYVAYCWAPIAGFSQFGSYTGNGSADGPFVYTGFRPRFLMWKNTNATSQWRMHDTSRSPYNASVNSLRANGSNAEDTSGAGDTIDFLSNGYKVRTAGTDINDSGNIYIYMAFAENPFKYANAR